jgi:hypothetical protein
VLAAITLLGRAASAAEPYDADAKPPGDRFDLHARSDTYVHMFERALLPGPAGATVSVDTLVPIHEYATVRAADIDMPWQADSFDGELSFWLGSTLGETRNERTFDGDVTTANVRQRLGPAYLRLGRQLMAGGAARFARFDGVSAGLASSYGLGADVYAGWTVLPRWSERQGYHHLGSSTDALVRSPDTLSDVNRGGYWLAGGRIEYAHEDLFRLGASIHDEHEDSALGRRNLGFMALVSPLDALEVGANTIIDLDAMDMAELRAFADLFLSEDLDLTGEYLRADPALFLSRQSVLSVFSNDAYDELGGRIGYRPFERLGFGAASYIQFFDEDRRGMRTTVRVYGEPDPERRLRAELSYTRVSDVSNGYRSLRAALRYQISLSTAGTAEQYVYLYDRSINGFTTSTVEAATLSWQPLDEIGLLGGASLIHSPYADLDFQVLARLSLELDQVVGGDP